MSEKIDKNDFNWDHIRRPWQLHILNLYGLIDKHSEMYVKTGELFHRQSYEILTKYLASLKSYIKENEKSLTKEIK